MSAQMTRAVVGNGGLYNGNNTSRNAYVSAQLTQTVMGNCGLYNGNITRRYDQMKPRYRNL